MRVASFLVLLTLVGAQTAMGQASSTQPQQPGRLLGIYDGTTGDPIAGVQVRDLFSGTTAVTTRTGTVSLGFVSFRGAAVIQLMKLGYQPKSIVVAPGDTAAITETMTRVTELPPVVTTEVYRIERDNGRWAGFEQRCAEKTITCFRETDLAARPGSNIADFLMKAVGITTLPCGGPRGRSNPATCGLVAMHSLSPQSPYCEPAYYVDGFLWDPRYAGSPIDRKPGATPTAQFTPVNVKGVEVYAAGQPVPPRFQGDPTCGSVVIWTK